LRRRHGIPRIVEPLLKLGFDGPTTLEVAGPESVKLSAKHLQEWSRGEPCLVR